MDFNLIWGKSKFPALGFTRYKAGWHREVEDTRRLISVVASYSVDKIRYCASEEKALCLRFKYLLIGKSTFRLGETITLVSADPPAASCYQWQLEREDKESSKPIIEDAKTFASLLHIPSINLSSKLSSLTRFFNLSSVISYVPHNYQTLSLLFFGTPLIFDEALWMNLCLARHDPRAPS